MKNRRRSHLDHQFERLESKTMVKLLVILIIGLALYWIITPSDANMLLRFFWEEFFICKALWITSKAPSIFVCDFGLFLIYCNNLKVIMVMDILLAVARKIPRPCLNCFFYWKNMFPARVSLWVIKAVWLLKDLRACSSDVWARHSYRVRYNWFVRVSWE